MKILLIKKYSKLLNLNNLSNYNLKMKIYIFFIFYIFDCKINKKLLDLFTEKKY